MMATMSILGLHDYTEGAVWDRFEVPEGVDADVVKQTILLECAELEVIYPNPNTMKTAIGLWSAAELPIWRKLYDTTNFIYNPIWNKDGTVIETETVNRLHSEYGNADEQSHADTSASRELSDNSSEDSHGESSTSSSESHSESEAGSREESTSRSQNENVSTTSKNDEESFGVESVDNDDVLTVAAFDSSAFENRERRVIDNDKANDSTTHAESTGSTVGDSTEHVIADGANSTERDGERAGHELTDDERSSTRQTDVNEQMITGNETSTERADDRSDVDSHDRYYERKEQGNIGVTTTQQMIKEEREVDQFNIYDYIVQSFKRRFCLLVY